MFIASEMKTQPYTHLADDDGRASMVGSSGKSTHLD